MQRRYVFIWWLFNLSLLSSTVDMTSFAQPVTLGLAGSSTALPSSAVPVSTLLYQSSFSLMNPLVSDLYMVSLQTNQPLQWADVHYVVLQRTESFNTSAIADRQINFMLQRANSDQSYLLNYIAFSPSKGESLAARFTLKPSNGDAMETDWHRYASNILDATSLSYSNVPNIVFTPDTGSTSSSSSISTVNASSSIPSLPSVSLLTPLSASSSVSTFPVTQTASGFYYVASILPSSMIALTTNAGVSAASSTATAALIPVGSSAYSILFQTSKPNSVTAVQLAYETSGLPAVETSPFTKLSSTIWLAELSLFPNESLQFRIQFMDIAVQRTNSTDTYTYRANLLGGGTSGVASDSSSPSSDSSSLLSQLNAASAQASANNLASFMNLSASNGICAILCTTGTRCLGGRCVDISTPCVPACGSSSSSSSTAASSSFLQTLPQLCVEGRCRSIAMNCNINCTGGATCMFGFCLQSAQSPANPITTPSASNFTNLPIGVFDTNSITAGQTTSTLLQPNQWTGLDYTSEVSPSTASTTILPIPTPSIPTSTSSSTDTSALSDYTVYFHGSAATLGPQGGLNWVTIHYRINNATQQDRSMTSIQSTASVPLVSNSDLLSLLPSPLSTLLPTSVTQSIQSPLSQSSSSASSVQLEFVLEHLQLAPADVLTYAFTYSIAALNSSNSILTPQQQAMLNPIVNTPWQSFQPNSANLSNPISNASLPTVLNISSIPSLIPASINGISATSAFPFTVSLTPLSSPAGLLLLNSTIPMTLPSIPLSMTAAFALPNSTVATPVTDLNQTLPGGGNNGVCLLPCIANPPSTGMSTCLGACTTSLLPLNISSITSLLSGLPSLQLPSAPIAPSPAPVNSSLGRSPRVASSSSSSANSTAIAVSSFPSTACIMCYEACAQDSTQTIVTCSNICATPCYNPNVNLPMQQLFSASTSSSSTSQGVNRLAKRDAEVTSSSDNSSQALAPNLSQDVNSSDSTTMPSPFVFDSSTGTVSSNATTAFVVVSSSAGDSSQSTDESNLVNLVVAASSTASDASMTSSSSNASVSSSNATIVTSNSSAVATPVDSPASASTGSATNASTSPSYSFEARGICNIACTGDIDQCYFGQCVDITSACKLTCAQYEMCVNSRCRSINYGCDVDCAPSTVCEYGFCVPTSSVLPNQQQQSTNSSNSSVVVVDPSTIGGSSSSSSSSTSFWNSDPPPPGVAPSAETAPQMSDLLSLMSQGTSLFQTFSAMIPGMSASPIGSFISGFSSIGSMFGNLFAGVSATSARETRGSSKLGTTSTSSTPCSFDGMYECLNACVTPMGSLVSGCVDSCWNYPCAVTTVNADGTSSSTDPKSLVRGLKLFSIMQQLAHRELNISTTSASSSGSSRRLLQFPTVLTPPTLSGPSFSVPSTIPSLSSLPTSTPLSTGESIMNSLPSLVSSVISPVGGLSTLPASPTATTVSNSNSLSTFFTNLATTINTTAAAFPTLSTNPFSSSSTASSSSTGSISTANSTLPNAILSVLSQASNGLSTAFGQDINAMSAISVLPRSARVSSTTAASTSTTSSTVSSPVDQVGIAGAQTSYGQTLVKPACGGLSLLTDGAQCGIGCMSVFAAPSLLGAGSCLSNCVNSPCISKNIAQLKSAQMKRILDQNAAIMQQQNSNSTSPVPSSNGASNSTNSPTQPAPTSAGNSSSQPPTTSTPNITTSGPNTITPLTPLDLGMFNNFPLSFPTSTSSSGAGSISSSSSAVPSTASPTMSSFYFPSDFCFECTQQCELQQNSPVRRCISEQCRSANTVCLIPPGTD